MAAKRPLGVFYLLLAFFGGFHVMLLEMCAFRVLYTNFGSSIFTSGVLLTLIMVALSVGYWLGGRMSERFASVRYLLLSLLGAVIYVHLFDVLLARQLIDWIFTVRGDLADGLVNVALRSAVPAGLATLALYAAPMAVLSQITPYLIKRSTDEQDDVGVGATAGRLMAVSTAGSIVGTLASTFALIPGLGVRGTLSVFSITVIILVLVGFLLVRRVTLAARAAAALAVLSTAVFSCGAPAEPGLVLAEETLYGSIKVYERKDARGRTALVYKPNRISAHTRAYVDQPLRNHYIMQSINLGEVFGAKRYLVLGLAGGSALNTLEAWVPGRDAVGVDIDPVSLRVARQIFKVPARMPLVAQDARMFLRDSSGARYDFIFVDLFQGEQIPQHCITRQFFELVRRRLTPGGMVSINSLMVSMPHPPSPPADDALVTAWNLHQTLYEAGFAAVFHNDIFNNGNVYAFATPIDEATLRARIRAYIANEKLDPNIRASLAGTYLKTFAVPRGGARAFTDGWTPETVFHLKMNITGFSEAVASAAQRSVGRRSLPSAELGDAYFSSLAAAPADFWKQPARRLRLCASAARAIATGHADVAQLARYQIDPLCAGLIPRRHPARRVLQAYLRGIDLLRKVEGEAALPLLLTAIDSLGGRAGPSPAPR